VLTEGVPIFAMVEQREHLTAASDGERENEEMFEAAPPGHEISALLILDAAQSDSAAKSKRLLVAGPVLALVGVISLALLITWKLGLLGQSSWPVHAALRANGRGVSIQLEEASTTRPLGILPVQNLTKEPSLFCAILVVPWTGEPKLVATQLAMQAGIFACDEHAVYSDHAFVIGDESGNITTQALPVNLHVAFDPWTKTAMNTWIFRTFWRFLMDEGRWQRHDWIVKVDADAVFIPSMLRSLVSQSSIVSAANESKGAWLNNCNMGLHGPIEVMSKKAMDVFNGTWHWCPQNSPEEDVFLKNCMWASGIHQVNAYSMLQEPHCNRWDYQACRGREAVAFHPFKDSASWTSCYQRALLDILDANGMYLREHWPGTPELARQRPLDNPGKALV